MHMVSRDGREGEKLKHLCPKIKGMGSPGWWDSASSCPLKQCLHAWNHLSTFLSHRPPCPQPPKSGREPGPRKETRTKETHVTHLPWSLCLFLITLSLDPGSQEIWGKPTQSITQAGGLTLCTYHKHDRTYVITPTTPTASRNLQHREEGTTSTPLYS